MSFTLINKINSVASAIEVLVVNFGSRSIKTIISATFECDRIAADGDLFLDKCYA